MKIQRKEKDKFRYYQEKADHGDAASQYYVAKCYANGEGIKKDSKKSMFYLEKSAELGFFKAQKTLIKKLGSVLPNRCSPSP